MSDQWVQHIHLNTENSCLFRMSCCSETERWMSANRLNLNQHSRRRRCLSADRPVVCFCSINGGSCHKYNFCRDKHVLSLARQNIFVSTNPLTLSHTFVATKDVFCRDKSKLIRQNYVCRDTHTFVETKDVFCRHKTFVATKMILGAAPANNTVQAGLFL